MTDKQLEKLSARAYEVGRKTAHKLAPDRYARKWKAMEREAQLGFRAMVKWVLDQKGKA